MRLFNLHYHKRFRMELDLRRWRRQLSFGIGAAEQPDYQLLSWSPELLADHAEAKYHSFRTEFDSVVFPCLSTYESCFRLMEEIRDKRGFVPEATWLAQYVGAGARLTENCGTIQAIRVGRHRANIQNIGVTPLHRGRGVGIELVVHALLGLQQVGVLRTCLEVTAKNSAAVRLYQRVGFRRVRTLYKAVQRDYSSAVG